MRLRLDQIVVDCRDPAVLVRFWAALLGGEPVDLHLDIEVRPGDVSAMADRAQRLGASRVGDVVTDESGSFQVMTDPEGNEFCFVSD